MLSTQEINNSCPQEFNCSGDYVSFSIGRVPSYVSLISSSFSCLGSILIFLAFLMLREIRTGAQKLITLLSIADFFTAFGYFIAAINFLQHYNRRTDDCGTFLFVCKVQSFITTTSSMSSFFWTVILATYFHMVIVNKQTVFNKYLFAFSNLIAWGVPLLITIPLLIRGKLGYSPLATSNWCFIEDSQFKQQSNSKAVVTVLFFIAGKFWELLSYIIVTILYISIAFSIHRSRKQLAVTPNGSTVRRENIKFRLLSIPIAFLLLRMWGTAQFFYSLSMNQDNVQRCISRSTWSVFFVLGVLQAVGDSGQGWSNAILYIFLSPTIRAWLLRENLINCYSKLYICCNDIDIYSRASLVNRRTADVEHESAASNRDGDSLEGISYGAVEFSEVPLCAQHTVLQRSTNRNELMDKASGLSRPPTIQHK